MTDSVSLLSLAVARRNLNISFVMFDILSGMNSLLRLELLSKCASQVCSGALLMLLQSTNMSVLTFIEYLHGKIPLQFWIWIHKIMVFLKLLHTFPYSFFGTNFLKFNHAVEAVQRSKAMGFKSFPESLSNVLKVKCL